MYKYLGKAALARTGARAGSRYYSSSFRPQKCLNLTKAAVATTFGITTLAIGLNLASSTISNEIDPEKLELAKQQAFDKVQQQSASKVTAKPTGGNDSVESDGSQSAAYNPETGEINWDCPCLGGMAHGPCGEEFKEAFACFVYSESEPKGIDCIKKFENMRNCFREHPEHYKEELYDDDEPEQAAPVSEPEAVTEVITETISEAVDDAGDVVTEVITEVVETDGETTD